VLGVEAHVSARQLSTTEAALMTREPLRSTSRRRTAADGAIAVRLYHKPGAADPGSAGRDDGVRFGGALFALRSAAALGARSLRECRPALHPAEWTMRWLAASLWSCALASPPLRRAARRNP